LLPELALTIQLVNDGDDFFGHMNLLFRKKLRVKTSPLANQMELFIDAIDWLILACHVDSKNDAASTVEFIRRIRAPKTVAGGLSVPGFYRTQKVGIEAHEAGQTGCPPIAQFIVNAKHSRFCISPQDDFVPFLPKPALPL
jgi:hypothetical protein